jgi:hypothetical protein
VKRKRGGASSTELTWKLFRKWSDDVGLICLHIISASLRTIYYFPPKTNQPHDKPEEVDLKFAIT